MNIPEKLAKTIDYFELGTETNDVDWFEIVKIAKIAYMYLELKKITPYSDRDALIKKYVEIGESLTHNNLEENVVLLEKKLLSVKSQNNTDLEQENQELEEELTKFKEEVRQKNKTIKRLTDFEEYLKEQTTKAINAEVKKREIENSQLREKIKELSNK